MFWSRSIGGTVVAEACVGVPESVSVQGEREEGVEAMRGEG